MSLVSSKERARGFGMFLTPDVSQTGGRGGGLRFTSQDTDIQGKVAKSLRCYGEFKASRGARSHLADGLGGLSCPTELNIIASCDHFLGNPVCQALCFPGTIPSLEGP